MTEEEVLKRILNLFDALNIPYALTGGLAVSFYGHPRSTHDFDLIIQIPGEPNIVKKLLEAFEKDFYISEEGIIGALLHKTMFNIIHHETGLKVDLWILKEDEYGREAFKRRNRVKSLGVDLCILSAEDMVIGKLLWYKVSEIEKHFNDAKGIVEIQKEGLDDQYLTKWSLKLSVNDLLRKIMIKQ